MLVSVVLPTYNRGQVISRCIDSVLSQKFADFELIIVDDGSLDNTKDIVSKYKDKRLKYFYKPNGGVSSARNYGILKSSGQYISFIDSDDLWLSNKLLCDYNAILLNGSVNIFFSDLIKITPVNVQSSFICCTKYFIKFINNNFDKTFLNISSRDAYSLLLKEVYIKTPTLTIKKELFFKYGLFLETLKSAEDWELLLRFVITEDICFLNKQNVIVISSFDSLHLIHKEKDHCDMIKVLKKIKIYNSKDIYIYKSANTGLKEMYTHLYWFYSLNRRWKSMVVYSYKAFCDTKKIIFLLRMFYTLKFYTKNFFN